MNNSVVSYLNIPSVLRECAEIVENKDKILSAYGSAINKIDDYFEYTCESKQDQEFVHKILDNLTEEFAKIIK